jgi:hypothetical protein
MDIVIGVRIEFDNDEYRGEENVRDKFVCIIGDNSSCRISFSFVGSSGLDDISNTCGGTNGMLRLFVSLELSLPESILGSLRYAEIAPLDNDK